MIDDVDDYCNGCAREMEDLLDEFYERDLANEYFRATRQKTAATCDTQTDPWEPEKTELDGPWSGDG